MFDQKEIDNAVVWENPLIPGSYKVTFDSPISPRENFRRAYSRNQMWMPSRRDQFWFAPSVIPDCRVRASVQEAVPYKGPVGGLDMFGIEWEYEEKAHGSIVRPGNPTLKDIKQWKEIIKFPDLDSWDWEGSAKLNREYLKNESRYSNLVVFTGWFERLISWMDAGPALLALMSKAQKPYVHEIFEAITDLWIKLVDKCHEAYGPYLDGFAFHDDWGAMHAPFFSPDTCREMIVPYMKRLTDHCHELGYTCELHSCGKIDKLVCCIVEAGWDSWEGMKICDAQWDYDNFGDKLILGIMAPEPADGINAPEEEQLKLAKEFVDKFGAKSKPIYMGLNSHPTPIEIKEIYRLTRLAYEEEK